jgi:hypothetical protein
MTRRKRAPKAIQHQWELTGKEDRVHTCAICGQWTGNLASHRYEVCLKRDRRKRATDRRKGA